MQVSTTLEFISLEAYGRRELANVLNADAASTSYTSKDLLSEKIKDTAAKIDGFVIRAADSKLWGFVLYTQKEGVTSIHDMYTFEAGRGNNLFKLIGYVFQKEKSWAGTFTLDDNAAPMERFFNGATSSLECNYSIKI
jgi:hypothetical protein